jgi:hypothetical protein
VIIVDCLALIGVATFTLLNPFGTALGSVLNYGKGTADYIGPRVNYFLQNTTNCINSCQVAPNVTFGVDDVFDHSGISQREGSAGIAFCNRAVNYLLDNLPHTDIESSYIQILNHISMLTVCKQDFRGELVGVYSGILFESSPVWSPSISLFPVLISFI